MFDERQLHEARSRWDIVTADVPMKRKGRELAGCCPFHAEKTPSFYVAPEKGFFHCFGCGAHGTVIDYVMRVRGLSFPDAMRDILGLPQQAPRESAAETTSQVHRDRDVSAALTKIICECTGVEPTTGAHLYLYSRGLRTRQPGLLAHPSLEYFEEAGGPGQELPPWSRWYSESRRTWYRGAKFPALIAPITSSEGLVVAIQRIWVSSTWQIDAAKDARAPVGTRKKSLGVMGDGAVRLRPAGPHLGIAEGVETAIGAMDDYRLPVWAACGVHRLGFPGHHRQRYTAPGERPVLWIPPNRPPADVDAVWIDERPPAIWIPPEVEHVSVFADLGETGELIAHHAANYWNRQGLWADVVLPQRTDGDFNDQRLDYVLAGGR